MHAYVVATFIVQLACLLVHVRAARSARTCAASQLDRTEDLSRAYGDGEAFMEGAGSSRSARNGSTYLSGVIALPAGQHGRRMSVRTSGLDNGDGSGRVL
jgi:hypothetical protein